MEIIEVSDEQNNSLEKEKENILKVLNQKESGKAVCTGEQAAFFMEGKAAGYSPTALLVSIVKTSFALEGLSIRVSPSPMQRTLFWEASKGSQVNTVLLFGFPVFAKLVR